ncbi:hypothetical protein Q3O60_10220 [Alkalimonas collagenimarina]|uniref:Tetratricopeptide repeat protein n=1 Tax=Alkalimonas collagenimarina TaxID=400390 RepID=A0ABT9GZV9_9GAMM|nr:hypothetical protein [Alkalimonas collagenimarina]MDP4536563.1 hypothetical protein [Alkalimonas collagenimarina]
MKNAVILSLFSLGMLVPGVSIGNETSPDFLKKEIEIAHTEYLNGSFESGIYALEALARILESDDSTTLHSDVGSNNLAFTYLRIGLLHEKSGNQSTADSYFTKAISSYHGEQVEIVQLKEAALQLDEIAMNNRS